MAGLFPRPAGPGTVAEPQLASLDALHAACRGWASDAPVHLPYLDLTFAFAFATLGDAGRARRLLADGEAALVAAPVESVPEADRVRYFLKAWFRDRTERALAGEDHAGPPSAALLTEWDELTRQVAETNPRNPSLAVLHAVNLYRMASRILEPTTDVDPYASWTRAKNPAPDFARIEQFQDAGELAVQLREFVRTTANGAATDTDRMRLLREALPLALRGGEECVVDTLGRVAAVLAGATGEGSSDVPLAQSRLADAALAVVAATGRGDLASEWAGRFAELVERFPAEQRPRLVRHVGPRCLRLLESLGRTNAIRETVARLRVALPPDDLGAHLVLDAGSLLLGETAPTLDRARAALLDAGGLPLLPKDYTDLACGYAYALGYAESGIERLTELFREMPPGRVTNTWTTKAYFSRLHVILSEEAVGSACRLLVRVRSA
jgi:hypothetical protein